MSVNVREELIVALHEKIRHLDKMQAHLMFSQQDVSAWWQVDAPFEQWSNAQQVSLSALKARFSELQDHLASTMQMIARIEEQDTRAFTYVLNYMVKISVLNDMAEWQQVRDLRNATTHDYSEADAVKSNHFEQVLQQANFLYAVLQKIKQFIAVTYP